MATIELTDDTLVVRVEGMDRLWALRRKLEIPLEHMTGARPSSDEAHDWLKGTRIGGAHIPGVLSVGHFYRHGKHVFWDVHHPERAIKVELRDEHYSHLVLEVEHPEHEIARINQAAVGAPT